MDNIREAVYSISKGDRILISLFTPVMIPILGWLAWDINQMTSESLSNKVVIWVLAACSAQAQSQHNSA
jgi:hypothetical protein